LCRKFDLFNLAYCDVGDDDVDYDDQNRDSIVYQHYAQACSAEIRADLVLGCCVRTVVIVCRYTRKALLLAKALQLTSVFHLLSFFLALVIEDPVVIGKHFEFIAILFVDFIALSCGRELRSHLELPLGSIEYDQERHEQTEHQCKEHFPFSPALTTAILSLVKILPNDIRRFWSLQEFDFLFEIEDLHILTIDSAHIALLCFKGDEGGDRSI